MSGQVQFRIQGLSAEKLLNAARQQGMMQHIGHGTGDAEKHRSDAAGHGQGFLMAVPDQLSAEHAQQPARDNGAGVDDCSKHKNTPPEVSPIYHEIGQSKRGIWKWMGVSE